MTLTPVALRCADLSLGWRLLFCVIGGGIAAFSLAPYNATPVMVLGLAFLGMLTATAPSWRVAGWSGWAFAFGYFGHGLSWIVEPFLVDIERHGWMAPFGLLFMAGGLALFWALAAALAFGLARNPLQRILVLPFTLALVELARAYVFTGFPWAGLPQGWIETPAIQVLSVVGPNGMALWIAAASIWPMSLIVQHARVRAMLVLPMVPMLALLGCGIWLSPPGQGAMSDTVVRVVQPNAPQDEKWHPDHSTRFFERQLKFSEAKPAPDLIVWPETAIPWFVEDAEIAFEVMADASGGVPIVLGAQRVEGRRYYNSLVVLDGSGSIVATYDKHHLVPFGEYVPFGNVLGRLGIHGLAANQGGGFSAGPGPELMDLGPLGRFIPLICYEAVFPQDLRGPERPDYLLQVTNDAWFGERSGPHQHLVQSRMRAIETGLPLVRSANTGVSAVIDPWGRMRVAIDLGTEGFADTLIPQATQPTLYSRTGDGPLAGFLFLVAAGLLIFNGRLKDKNSD